jgi:hypothetical protein
MANSELVGYRDNAAETGLSTLRLDLRYRLDLLLPVRLNVAGMFSVPARRRL